MGVELRVGLVGAEIAWQLVRLAFDFANVATANSLIACILGVNSQHPQPNTQI